MKNRIQKTLIGIIGAADCNQSISKIAYQVGEMIAKQKAVLVCGGRGGVMEAAAQGAFENGGATIGLLPGDKHSAANPYITIALPTGLGHARNALIAQACHGLIAVSGGYGTLSEIALALKMNKPIIGISSWNLGDHLQNAATPDEAVSEILKQCR